MADYYKAIPYTLDFEGGLTEDAADSGGITNFGVCLEFAKDTGDMELFDKNDDGTIDRKDIKLLKKEDAEAAFKKYFWDKLDLDNIDSDKKAFVVFDCSMNSGIGNAVPMLQKALVNIGYNIDIDGKYGPQTKKAFNDAPEDDFCDEYLNVREKFFRMIVDRRPSQKVFLRGWLNRVNQIREIIKTYPEEQPQE